jgi:hypothetical protein
LTRLHKTNLASYLAVCQIAGYRLSSLLDIAPDDVAFFRFVVEFAASVIG